MSKQRRKRPRDKLAEIQGKLRDEREKKDLTQKDLAKRLGRTQSFVSKYETAERRLDVLELNEVCTALGIRLSTFTKRIEKLL